MPNDHKISGQLQGREILFEFHPIGSYVKVTALDVKTLTEISIQGARGMSSAMLQQNALKRLEYVLRKNGVII
jgi:hypothetical protein